MKKLLFFNDTLEYGGSEILLTTILNFLSEKDQYKITLMLPYPSGNNSLIEKLSSKVKIAYVYTEKPDRKWKILYENLMSFFPNLYLKYLKIDLNNFDTIICFKDCIYSKAFSKAKIRKILWIHNLPTIAKYKAVNLKEYLPIILLRKRIKRLIKSYRKYNDVVCVSNISKVKYIDVFNNGKVPKQNIHVIYNTIDTQTVFKLANTDSFYSEERAAFVMVSRLSHEKRIDRVINASKMLLSKGYHFRVEIIGDGVLQNDLQKQIDKGNLSEHIKLRGYKKNPYPYIKNSDWLICSSEKESFSLVLLESIFLGTSVISTECGGPNEILDGGKYGILTPNNTDGIYEGMKLALDNPALAAKYKSKAVECLKRFDYDEWLKSVEMLINNDK